MTIADLIARWTGTEGGAERANYQMFLSEFAQAMGLPAPQPKGAGLGAYEFEAPVRSEAALGRKGTGRIDLYKRDCFILEAKQSQLKPGETAPAEPAEAPPKVIYDLFGHAIGAEAPARAMPRYDRLMADARLQAERYALALPGDHIAPPFLIVADIGRAFELYFDWSGNGRGYAPFPGERQYRIALADLASDRKLPGVDLTAADLLRAVWTDPASVDPRLKAAEVTRQVAVRLSKVAAHLENARRLERPDTDKALLAIRVEDTSLFIMRLLFCMFAEDVELLPAGKFAQLLRDARDEMQKGRPGAAVFWRASLEELWRMMAAPGEQRPYWLLGRDVVRYFNGNLFSDRTVYDLDAEHIGELLIAAEKQWKNVEPAIFGTLLEQVLEDADRAKLGAHYTPRAYVERLVDATMLEVLRPEWDAVRERARGMMDTPLPLAGGAGGGVVGQPLSAQEPTPDPSRKREGGRDGAIALVTAFHARLAALRVLDPACGTGNFLYVAMEQLLRLEGEVRQFAAGLGADLQPTVHPNQFLGLELNPRAAVIAELVLWIGWLRYRLANTPEAIGEPVLPTLTNINFGTHGGYDAVVARTGAGEPDAENPRRPEWPEADFIVGNPPFIGGQDIRRRLGGDYAAVLWKANPRVAKSADFVMQWWDRAADILTRPGTRLRRFGFVTTNSITQVFSRRVIEGWLSNSSPERGGGPRSGGGAATGESLGAAPPPSLRDGPPPRAGEDLKKLHLTFAIADHPWTRVTKDAAAVRIAMTVAEAGAGDGRLVTITSERAIDTDAPELEVTQADGVIHADLSVEADVTRIGPLLANSGICHDGVKLHGRAFAIDGATADRLGLAARDGLDAYIRRYRNGRDLTGRPVADVSDKYVIDLFGLTEQDIFDRFPEVSSYLLDKVKPERDKNRRESYRKNWWIFGEPRREMRPALVDTDRYISTVDTARHRVFQFVDASVVCDDGVVIIASDQAFDLGVLSSNVHLTWVLRTGGWLGVGNDSRYNKSKTFDPFPFPAATDAQRETIGAIAERLDATRRTALAENPSLTMTGLYNLVAAIRGGTLAEQDEAAAVKARARIVAKLHDDLDAAVADAYGWPPRLTPAEIVTRLVALNAERAAEEAAGHVRWLRPEYQAGRFG